MIPFLDFFVKFLAAVFLTNACLLGLWMLTPVEQMDKKRQRKGTVYMLLAALSIILIIVSFFLKAYFLMGGNQ